VGWLLFHVDLLCWCVEIHVFAGAFARADQAPKCL
jgi:hypothetical protein